MTSPITQSVYISVIALGDKSYNKETQVEINKKATVREALAQIGIQASKGTNLVFHEIVVNRQAISEFLKKDPGLEDRDFFEFMNRWHALDSRLNVIIKSLL
jgi:hypothetical protein